MMGVMALDMLRSALVRTLSRQRRPPEPIRFDRDDAEDFDTVAMADGSVLRTHAPGKCLGVHCCIHNPSDHALSTAPLSWRWDRSFMERICDHGVGHPDPDSVAFLVHQGIKGADVYGCDGCCQAVAR